MVKRKEKRKNHKSKYNQNRLVKEARRKDSHEHKYNNKRQMIDA